MDFLDLLFNAAHSGEEVFLDVVGPETEDCPAGLDKMHIHFIIPLHIAFNFLLPEFGIVLWPFGFDMPVLAMEKFAVDENGNLIFLEGKIGSSENGFIVFTVAMAASP